MECVCFVKIICSQSQMELFIPKIIRFFLVTHPSKF